MSVVTMKSLLESGVHFGHQTRRWDPRMAKYIFAERNGIHIIDLQKTIVEIKKAYDVVRKVVLENKPVLFVGTKKQARQAIKAEAEKCGQFFVNNRWLGGTLTNFATIKKSINRLKKIEKMEVDGTFDSLVKKEKVKLLKEKEKLEKNLGGIKNMNRLPGILFIVDSKKESIAVNEANKLKIPVVAIVDTNCNPDNIDYPIPGNDDAIRAIELFCSIVSSACIDANNEAGASIIVEGDAVAEKIAIEVSEIPNKDKEQSGTDAAVAEEEPLLTDFESAVVEEGGEVAHVSSDSAEHAAKKDGSAGTKAKPKKIVDKKEHKEHMDHGDQKDKKDHKEHKEHQENKEHGEHKEHSEHKEHKEHKTKKDSDDDSGHEHKKEKAAKDE